MKQLKIMLVVTLIMCFQVIVCNANGYSEVEARIQKGQTKLSVLKLLGEPLSKNITKKQDKFIWGPEEEFWDGIPMGSQLEVWKYEFSDGYLNLYFIRAGEHLDFKAFAPKGVRY